MKTIRLLSCLLLFLLVTLFSSASVSGVDSEVHDVAVINVTAWPTFVLPRVVYVNITVENQGTIYETFNLTLFAGNLTIQNVTAIDLAPGLNQTLTLNWEPYPARATIFPPPWPLTESMRENLTIWAEAAVVAGEVDISDNVCINGVVTIIWWCVDVNVDGRIDGKDIAFVAKAFGSFPGHPRWDSFLDLNQDGKIEGKEIAALAKAFGAKYA